MELLQRQLGGTAAIATFTPTYNGVIVCLSTKSGMDQRLVPISIAQLTKYTNQIRVSTTFRDIGQLPPFDVEAASQLHSDLLGWASEKLKSIKTLHIIAAGPLATIPFSLLIQSSEQSTVFRHSAYVNIPWLTKKHATVHAPSISSWLTSQVRPSSVAADPFIAWADPDFLGSSNFDASKNKSHKNNFVQNLPRLPETRLEANAIARALNSNIVTDVISGRKATRSSVINLSVSGVLERKRVIMFATHGITPDVFSGISQPALALAFDPEDQNSSLLSLDDVLGLRLNAEMVMLSACNTASPDNAEGDPLSGLARGFFFAGARSLLVTHWEVDSDSAVQITSFMMKQYGGKSRPTRAEALQRSQLQLINGAYQNKQWSHPAYWAAYTLVGNGGR